jgi:hypothetical protein
MTELPAGLVLYRSQLRSAIAHDLRDHPARRRALRVGLPAAGLVAAASLALTLTSGSPVPSADAAILHHVARALSSPPDMILHERAMVTASWGTAPYELWQETSPPYAYTVSKWGHSGTGTASAPEDFAVELRDAVSSGQATVDGSVTFHGVAAYKLTVNGTADRFVNGTAYVAQSNYYPLEIDTTASGGELIVYQTYEYLPATASNLRRIRSATPAANRAAHHSRRLHAR